MSIYAALYGEDDSDWGSVYGTTSSDGLVTLTISLCVQSEISSHRMNVYITDECYNILSSSDTQSDVSYILYPEFEVLYDVDRNWIYDPWELPLAEKFCPSFKLHSAESINKWIAPEPVEYLGVAKQDLWFLLYNELGQEVDDYPIDSEADFIYLISDTYPWMVSSDPNYSFLTGDGYYYVGQPPGKSYESYWLRFHYNYAGNANTPDQWISYYQTERNQNAFPHTVYAICFYITASR